MAPSELRKMARESLKGNWGKGVCIILAYFLITFLIGFVMGFFEKNSFVYTLLYIAEIVITLPLSFGLIISFIKLKRNEQTSSFGFLSDGFSRFKRAWAVYFRTLVKLILPIICLILSVMLMVLLIMMTSKSWFFALIGVVLYIVTIVYVVSRSLLYSLAYFIAYDEPSLSSKECVEKSESLMLGNRGNYLLLELSFIGWAFLACLTFGIGFLWLIPYMQVSLVCFYEKVAKIEEKPAEEVEKVEE